MEATGEAPREVERSNAERRRVQGSCLIKQFFFRGKRE